MPSHSPDEIIESAIALARAVLATNALERHKRELLSACIWKASEASGKYDVPYWSEGVLSLVQEHGSIKSLLRLQPRPVIHEHVNTRKSLVETMLCDPDSVERVLRNEAIACLVTPEEHSRLIVSQTGFDRYYAVGVRVWDVPGQCWIDEISNLE